VREPSLEQLPGSSVGSMPVAVPRARVGDVGVWKVLGSLTVPDFSGNYDCKVLA
jgi:hypothetical protein